MAKILETFLSHPILWGVLALFALAIALSGRLSVSAATAVLWIAWAAAVFGVFSTEAALKDPVIKALVLIIAASTLALGAYLVQEWFKMPLVDHTETPHPPPASNIEGAKETKAANTEEKLLPRPHHAKAADKPTPIPSVTQGPGSAFSVNQQGGITASNVFVTPTPPLQLKWTVRDMPSYRPETPYQKEVAITTNTTYAPVSVAISCDSEIEKVWIVGLAMDLTMGVSQKTIALIKYSSPALNPGETLRIEIAAKQPFAVQKVQQAK